MTTTLHDVLGKYREDARNNRDLGDRFEWMILRFLQVDPIYAERFSKVWMWNDWPDKGNVGDIGIDLVAQERATGEYCGIQCKFYLPEHTLAKGDIDSFFTALGREAFTSGIIVSTTDAWGKNAKDALEHQTKPVTRLSVHDLAESPIDWSTFDDRRPQALERRARKTLRPHQQHALDDVVSGLSESDRGKLIMACGTGKTFTSLKIAETLAPGGHLLFLVPSLSLLSQSLREWTAEAEPTLHSLAVCSDPSIGKSRRTTNDDNADITIHDLAFPATTSASQLAAQYKAIAARKEKNDASMTVVFSTYHSIEAVSKAQKAGLPDFDLIICDEAHRTTGVTLADEDESHFVRVHDAAFISARKRLYMTATPRIYGDDAKSKAKDAAAELCSMDNVDLFGKELHRLGFGEAVGHDLLSDYKVLVLAVDEKYIAKTFQKQIADDNSELNLDDATRITGCWNGLEKRFEALRDNPDMQGDIQPMRQAVAFSRTIKDSKAFVSKFGQIIDAYKETHPDVDDVLDVEAKHVDGSFDALRRGALLDWLKAETVATSTAGTCRVLSNARCLSEGVDVPALDAVMFLNPRNSVIDVVQSVGRVMRKAPDKRFGYIILPIGIPADMTPEEALKDNKKYKIVWQVLQALRAHDDRFNATINQIELNKKRPDKIQVIGVGGPDGGAGSGSASDGDSKPKVREVQGRFAFPQLDEWKDAIYAKIVKKVGDRAYWETWAQDIARIADQHITRIKALLDPGPGKDVKHRDAFGEFLAGLRANLNPAITEEDAIEMLAQHSITKPVFDALFANYAFTEHNPVSQSMQTMLDLLHEESIEKEAETLEKFYNSVRDRAKGLDNAEARQKVVIELYEEFFKNAFPRMAERLGIVYTPVEVVDFIIHSVEDILREEFNSGLGEKDVHIIDPFTGTGTFLVRLLQSGLIPPDTLAHKYQHELHANEIVLLAYYIAAINIEESYHGLLAGDDAEARIEYKPFDGIVLTDTFQLYETQHDEGTRFTGHFPENTKRAKRQQEAPIRVVIANPPYSAKQGSANDANQNLRYARSDERIERTYASASTASLKSTLYDSYIRAIRWASDRINGRGVIGFVTNGSFIDTNSMDGLRACLEDEFTSLYVFNLRGNQRTSGELSRKEGGKLFGSGSRAPIAITILVKNPDEMPPARINYHDIGDYLSRDEKLRRIRKFASVHGLANATGWSQVKPNKDHDWINQRDPVFLRFLPMVAKDKTATDAIFGASSPGLATSRDTWVYGYSREGVSGNVSRMSAFYREQVQIVEEASRGGSDFDIDHVIDSDARKISWSRALKKAVKDGKLPPTDDAEALVAAYRPFQRMWLHYDPFFIESIGRLRQFVHAAANVVITIPGKGSSNAFQPLITDCLVDYNSQSAGAQCFPLYLYEPVDDSEEFDFCEAELVDGYRRRDAITDAIHIVFRDAYGNKVTKEDIFYYVYGILHSPEYRERFAANLKKTSPRIPLTKEADDFWTFSKAGRDLAALHLNYETVEPWDVDEHSDTLDLHPWEQYKVKKVTFGRPTKEQKAEGEKYDKTRIIYNSHVAISHIPLEAYDYIVNGKPAIEWIMERYQVTRDKKSGIVNDPNDWCKEHDQPRYIIDLIQRIIRVSIETMRLVNALPALNER